LFFTSVSLFLDRPMREHLAIVGRAICSQEGESVVFLRVHYNTDFQKWSCRPDACRNCFVLSTISLYIRLIHTYLSVFIV